MTPAPSERTPAWPGPAVALLGITGVLLAGALYPVADPRPLKMSCYWAMHAAVAVHVLVGCCGLLLLVAQSREAVRLLAAMAAACAVVLVVTIHVLIPVMLHNVAHQRAHDLLAALVALVALATIRAARPEVSIDEALDATEPAVREPGA